MSNPLCSDSSKFDWQTANNDYSQILQNAFIWAIVNGPFSQSTIPTNERKDSSTLITLQVNRRASSIGIQSVRLARGLRAPAGQEWENFLQARVLLTKPQYQRLCVRALHDQVDFIPGKTRWDLFRHDKPTLEVSDL